MAKISARKLVKKLEHHRDTIPDNTEKSYAYKSALNVAIDYANDMWDKAKRKKADKVVRVSNTDSPKEISPMLMQYGLFLSQTSTILSSGKGKKIYSVGDVIPIMYLGKPVDFDIAEVADHGIKLISHDILAFQPFDINDNNAYDKSSVKDYLENEFEKCFDAEFIKLLNGNKFYLPSENEIIKAYPDEKQRVKRYKNEIWWYWTGTPNASYSRSVRYVTTDGSLSYSIAYSARGLAPACVIGRLD